MQTGIKSIVQSRRRSLGATNIRNRILTRGVGLTVVPLTLVLVVVWIANGVANMVSVDGSSKLANRDLNHVVMSLLSACKLYDGYLSGAVNGAKTLLNRTGAVQFDAGERINWQAKDQVTSQVITVALPLMKVGQTALRPVASFTQEAPIVDEVHALYDLSATVFQRMNAQGDMLRVSTTVKKADGTRAIGTYIPALGAGGKPNPVISTVLKGETYLGRAFVVNSWYMAAYQPLKDAHGSVIGMIYTGMPEGPVRDKIVQFKNLSDSDGGVNIFIVHTAGKEQGLFVLSDDPSLQDHVAWNYRDARGQLYVQEICKRAVANKGSISEASYWSQAAPGKPSEKIVVRFSYFPAWDWVIGVQEPERQFLATPTQIKHIFWFSNCVPLLLVIISTWIGLVIWSRFTDQMTDEVATVMKNLENSSVQVAGALEAISGNANSVGYAADHLSRSTQTQAAAAEQTSATTGQITETAKRNSRTAERMLTLATDAEGIVLEAKKTMLNVDGAMHSILSTNDEALSIIDTINEISFATNIVALNASIEAARAGEAGRTFVFIAQEVRELAQKVAAAAQETRKIISNSREELSRGSDSVGKLRLALIPMDENTDQVRKLAVDVTSTSVTQAEGMQQVLLAVEEMQKSTEQTAETAMQSTRNATDLRSQVAALADSVKTVDQAVNKLNQQFFGMAQGVAQ